MVVKDVRFRSSAVPLAFDCVMPRIQPNNPMVGSGEFVATFRPLQHCSSTIPVARHIWAFECDDVIRRARTSANQQQMLRLFPTRQKQLLRGATQSISDLEQILGC